MTRKHFEMIAQTIREGRRRGLFASEAAAETFALSWIEPLGRENPRFDYERFMDACGFESDDSCPECGATLRPDEFCRPCSQAAGDFERMAYGW